MGLEGAEKLEWRKSSSGGGHREEGDASHVHALMHKGGPFSILHSPWICPCH
jgi:hypothetical protein